MQVFNLAKLKFYINQGLSKILYNLIKKKITVAEINEKVKKKQDMVNFFREIGI